MFRQIIRFATQTRGFSECKNIGFIGLGNMGRHMYQNLVKKGYDVMGYDLDTNLLQSLKNNGAKVASSTSEIMSSVDCVITMLPASAHLHSLYKGENGVLKCIKPGTLVIDCSTIDPITTQKLAPDFESIKADFIDAPVSGGVLAAEKGTLTFMAGGKPEVVKKAEPILQSMGSKVIYCGGTGSGEIAKMCNNLLLAISMVGVSEAMNLGVKLGMDPKLLASVINSSSGRCWSSDTYNPAPGVIPGVPSNNDYKPGFTVKMMTKDLKIAETAAAERKLPFEMGKKTLDIYTELSRTVDDKDFSITYKYFQDKN